MVAFSQLVLKLFNRQSHPDPLAPVVPVEVAPVDGHEPLVSWVRGRGRHRRPSLPDGGAGVRGDESELAARHGDGGALHRRQVCQEAPHRDAGEAGVRDGLKVDGEGRLPKRRHELAVAHEQARPGPGGLPHA